MSIFRRIQAVEAKILAVKEKAHFLALEKQKFLANNVLYALEVSNKSLSNAMIRSGCGKEECFDFTVDANSTTIFTDSPSENSAVAAKPAVIGKKKGRKSISAVQSEKKVIDEVAKTVSNTAATTSSSDSASGYEGIDYIRLIPEAKFNSLPESTRGRVAYSDIVHTYRQLVQFIKQNTIVPHVSAHVAAAHTKNRRQSMSASSNNGRRASVCKPKVTNDLPPLTYSVRELSMGALAANNPFQMEKESSSGRMPIKLTGKTGSCVLMSLRAMGLVKLDIGSSTSDALTVVLSDDLETELLAFKHQLISQEAVLNPA